MGLQCVLCPRAEASVTSPREQGESSSKVDQTSSRSFFFISVLHCWFISSHPPARMLPAFHPSFYTSLHPTSHACFLSNRLPSIHPSFFAVSRNVIGAHLLHELLSTQWLHALLQIYECLLTFKRLWPRPFLSHASALSREVVTPSVEATELQILLSSPHMKALLSCHDAVAQADFGPVLAPLPDGLPVDEEVVRIVCLAKNEQPLGATIRKDKETGEIFIARVIRGGLADRSGLLHPGDLLVEVDGKPKHAPKFSVASPVPCVSPIICVTHTCSGIFILEMHAEAMVDYCPLQDSSIPCPDVGVFFSKGEVLEVLDQTDGQWWQARKITSSASFAGLIPSAATLKRSPDAITNMDRWTDSLTTYFCLLRRSLSKRRRRSSTTITAYCANVATPYEEVVLYRRPPGDHHRLIILVGEKTITLFMSVQPPQ
uniref:Membrane protein, palmitoylated 4a (MAGUK p55 subfamily member 4) n=1 Tax=Hippocampus comes TaxID=109280 RepID=A0A3Q2XM45_HIPCM